MYLLRIIIAYLYAILYDPQASRLLYWDTPEEFMPLEDELKLKPYEFDIPDYKAFEKKYGKSLKVLVRQFQIDAIIPKYIVDRL